MYPSPRSMLRSALLLSSTLAGLTACHGSSDLVGTFGGTWNLGGQVMVLNPDGTTATHGTADTPSGVESASEVVVTTSDDRHFQVTIAAPFMACTLTAQLNDAKELVLDGPSSADLPSGPAKPGPWQHCPFTLKGFRGEAHVRGTVRGRDGGLTIVMQVLPHGATEATRVTAGSAAMANFVGNRHNARR